MHRFSVLFLRLSKTPQWAIAAFMGLCVGLLSVPQPVYAASIGATVGIANAPTTVPLGEGFSLDLIFDNNSAATGFGPYINLFVPKSGADGDDGYTFSAATYLGAPITAITMDCPAGSSITSPLTGLTVTCPLSPLGTHQWVILQLPFGSFAAHQPPIPVRASFTMSNKADVGLPLPISAQAGFIYGSSAIGAEPSASGLVSTSIAPSLLTLTKDYSGLEGETATGPNFPRSFVIRASMPAGLTATDILITDTLPNNIVYLGTTGSGVTVLQQPTIGSGPFSTPPSSNLLVLSVPGNVVGTGPTITVNYYVTATASEGGSVLGSSGTPSQTVNSVAAQATWSPVDLRDSGSLITATASASHRDLALAIQKSVSNASPPNSPNDALTYRLAFQVSDFLTVGGLVVTDTLANGHDYVADSAQLSVTDRAGNIAGTFPITATTLTLLPNGDTRLVFDVSAALLALGAADGVLQGGHAIAPNSGAANGQLLYRATISDQYHGSNADLQPNDTLTNTAQIGGLVLSDNDPFTRTLDSVGDSTQVTLALAAPSLAKSIYAINGNLTLPSPLKISPDDAVTYLLRYDLPTGDMRNLTLTDYLPLPMFDATTLTAFISSTSGIPAEGSAQWATPMSSGDLSRITVPTLITDADQNAVSFGFGTHSDPNNIPTQIALLFTVKASTRPYVDDLYFTNQVSAQQENSAGQLNFSNAIVPFRSAAPQLRIRKGVVSASNPNASITQTVAGPVSFAAAGTGTCANRFSGVIRSSELATTPIDGNLINADAGDTVRYAIVIENTGSGQRGAFDVALRDALPSDVSVVPGSLCVQSGAGNLLETETPSTTLFTSGLTLTAVLSNGQDYVGDITGTGDNIAVISFDAVIASAITPTQQLTNTATLQNYAATAGGANFVPIHPPSNSSSDTARVSFSQPRFEKRLLASEWVNDYNSNTQAALGEIVTYTLVITIPEGITPNAVITDNLPTGLAFVSFITASVSPALQMSVPLTALLAPAVAPASGTTAGNRAVRALGTITNTDSINTVAETIQLTFTAVVLNVTGNVAGNTKTNQAQFAWTDNTTALAAAAAVTLIEPSMGLRKSVTPAAGDSGDALTYTLVLTGPSGGNAFDVVLFDALPVTNSGTFILSPSIASVSNTGTPALGVADFDLSGSNSAGYVLRTASALNLPLNANRTITLVITGTLAENVLPSGYITNTAQITYTSLDQFAQPMTRSGYNVNSTERTYTRSVAISSRVSPLEAQKVLIGTSEDHTDLGPDGLQRVAIGEVVAYRMAIRMAEGTSPNLSLDFLDNLPSGLQYIPNSARVGFVANGRGITSSLITNTLPSCGALNISAGMLAAVPASAITCPFPASQISLDAKGRPKFSFGTVANLDTDNDDEYVIVQLSAVVLNQLGNQSGTQLPNTMDVLLNGRVEDSSEPITVTVAESAISIGKTVNERGLRDGGDVLTYTLMISNGNGANTAAAFDVVVTDVLDSNLQVISASLSAPTVITRYTSASDGWVTDTQRITATLGQLDANQAATLTVWARVWPTATNGTLIPNTAALSYSSLPTLTGSISNALGIATPGASGTISGERSSAGGVNDYAAGNGVSVTLNTPSIIKLAPSSSQYAIGDEVTYTLWLTVPEGVAQAVSLLDDLPPGLGYVRAQLLTVGYNGAISSPAITQTNGDVVWAFGNITTTADNDALNDGFAIQVIAQVLNNSVPINQNGSVLSNSAWLTYTHPTLGEQLVRGGAQAIHVIEPSMQLSKAVLAVRQPVGAHDELTYTLRITNTGSAVAHDVVMTDALPSGVRFVATQQFSVGNSAITTDTNSVGASALRWRISRLDAGQTAWVTYTAQVNADVGANQNLVNVAQVFYSSLPRGVAEARSYTGTATSASITSGLPRVGIVKHVDADIAQPGTRLTYTLTVSNDGDVMATNVVITDPLPLNTSYLGSIPSAAQTDGVLTWTMGTLAAKRADTITLTVQVDGAAASGMVIANEAWVSDGNGGVITPSSQVKTAVAWADVYVRKSVQPTRAVLPGEVLTWTIDYGNAGPSVADRVQITDGLPSGLTFGGLISNGEMSVTMALTQALPQLRWLTPTLAAGAHGQIVFTSTATVASSPQGLIINTVDITTSSAQTRAGLGNEHAEATAQLTQPRLGVRKFSANEGGNPLRPGERVTYTIVVRNEGTADATDVSISDTLPVWATWVSGSLSVQPSNTGVVLGVPPLLAQHAVVPAGQAITLSYAAVLTAPLANGSVLLNRVAISNSVGVITATDSVSDVVASAHALQLEKWAEPSAIAAGQLITYGLRYTITGNALAPNLVLTDVLPAQTTLVSCNGCSANGQTLRWALGNVVPPMTGGLMFRVRAAANITASGDGSAIITNVAVLADDDGQQAMAQASVRVGTHAALSIRKSVTPTAVRHGDVLTYTLVVHNDGPSDTGRGESIVMPGNTGSTIGPATPYPSVLRVSDLGAITDITVSINGIQHSYAGDLDVLLVGPQGQKIMLMSDVGGIYPAKNVSLSFHDGAALLPDADPLSSGIYRPTNYIANDGIETLPAPAPGLPYDSALSGLLGTSANGDWQLFVLDDQKNDEGVFINGWALALETNAGNRVCATNAGVLISDWLPPGLRVLDVQPGFAAGNLALWSTSLAAGETKTYTVVAQVWHATSTWMTNTATITGTQPEDALSDNISSASGQVLYTDLAITVTPPVSYTPGTSVMLPITISNDGNLTVSHGLVTITLPPGIALPTVPPGWHDLGGGVYEVPIGPLPPGGGITLEVPMAISPILPPGSTLPVVIEVGDVDAPGADSNPSNNSDTADTPINREVHLSIWKASTTETASGLAPGDVITYQLWVSNTSGFAATQVSVRDGLPEGTVYVKGSGQPAPAIEGDTLVWAVPMLAPYTAAQINFTVMISTTSVTQTAVLNTFTVDSNETSLQTSNEVENPYRPTAIHLSYFKGTRISATQVGVAWETTLELNTWGFDLYRSADELRNHAVKVTPSLIAAEGRNGGATYSFHDAPVSEGQRYFYWLVETELEGQQREYGPIDVSAQPTTGNAFYLYLPVLLK